MKQYAPKKQLLALPRSAPKKAVSKVKGNIPRGTGVAAFFANKWTLAVLFVFVFGGLGTYLLLSSFAATGCVTTTWRLNAAKPYMKGSCVSNAQQMLTSNGISTKGTDGVYGPSTKAAVLAFQKRSNNSDLSKNGVLNPKTWSRLCTRLKTYSPSNEGVKAGSKAGCRGGSYDKTGIGSISTNSARNMVASSSSRTTKVNKMIKLAIDHSYTSPKKGRSAPKISYGWYTGISQADCGVFVGAMIKRSGMDSSWPASSSAAMRTYAKSSSKWQTLALTKRNLRKGDIILVPGHVLIWAGSNAGLSGSNVAFEAAQESQRAASQIPYSGNSAGNVVWSMGRTGGFIARLK